MILSFLPKSTCNINNRKIQIEKTNQYREKQSNISSYQEKNQFGEKQLI
jgi:hypothetical protein